MIESPPSTLIQVQPSSSKLPLILVGPILMLTVGAGGVYLGKYLYGSKTPGDTMNATPTPEADVSTATPIIDTTTNWKAYTNTTYEYTLEYPDSWIEKIKCEGGTKNDDYICFISPDFTESSIGAISGSTTGGGLVWIDNKGDLVGLSPRDFCNSSSGKIKECKEISVSGMRAMKRTWNSTTQVGIVKNDKVVISFRVIYNEKSEKEILVTFDQILSTFRFTNDNSKDNYLHLTKYLIPTLEPGDFRYIKGKDVVVEFPQRVIIDNMPIRDETGAIVADASVKLNGNTYYIANLRGWPGARLDDCGFSQAERGGCLFNFTSGSIVALRWVYDEKGIAVLNVQDIRIETYHLDNFSIYKGPLGKVPIGQSPKFLGRFEIDEVDVWKTLLSNANVKTISKDQ